MLIGAISEIYKGTSVEAIPTPRPPISLPMIKIGTEPANAQERLPITNNILVIKRTNLRPTLSLKKPAIGQEIFPLETLHNILDN